MLEFENLRRYCWFTHTTHSYSTYILIFTYCLNMQFKYIWLPQKHRKMYGSIANNYILFGQKRLSTGLHLLYTVCAISFGNTNGYAFAFVCK